MSIPVIDLARFTNGDAAERKSVARETDRICREIGFLGVVGHGVPDGVIGDLYARSKAFFHQPAQAKLGVRQPAPEIVRGYIGFGKGALGATRGEKTPPDMKESYTIGPERTDGETPAANIWPAGDPSFRSAWLAYYAQMERLGLQMMRLFAEALDLETDHFDAAFGHHPSILSAIYYPDQVEPPKQGQLRAGAHTDFGTMTILRPDNAPGGLQVMSKAGDWLAARVPAGGFVVNIGDMMARWTNDRWVSTLHRVVNPPRDLVSGTERLSIGFFHQPNDDFVVECLPGCRDAEGRALYPPVAAGDYMTARFNSQIVPAAKTG
jgi:isopenicillin N synthase-like dioxygenase